MKLNKLKMPEKPMAEEELDQDLEMEELEAPEDEELEDEELAMDEEGEAGLLDDVDDETLLAELFQNRGLTMEDAKPFLQDLEDADEELDDDDDEFTPPVPVTADY